MSVRPPRLPALPLAVWAVLGTLATAAVAVGVTAGLLAGRGGIDGRAVPGLLGGLLAGALAAATAGLVVGRVAGALRGLRSDAVRRLHDPLVGPGRRRPTTMAARELRELADTFDALHLRVRVADDVAARHRDAAETASAGMFELLSGLVAAEEATRGQLSAELHDTVAQSLMGARSLLAVGQPEAEELARASELVAEAEEQVRAVMARTRPPALRDGDLAAAVAGLVDDMAQRYGLRVDLDWPAEPQPLPLVTAVTVYRFFQEALLNVVKHADVDEARARLALAEDAVMAEVGDAGPGFDPEEVRPERGRHVGLGLLRERARLAGGAVAVSSWPGTGTTITLRLPRAPAPRRLHRTA